MTPRVLVSRSSFLINPHHSRVMAKERKAQVLKWDPKHLPEPAKLREGLGHALSHINNIELCGLYIVGIPRWMGLHQEIRVCIKEEYCVGGCAFYCSVGVDDLEWGGHTDYHIVTTDGESYWEVAPNTWSRIYMVRPYIQTRSWGSMIGLGQLKKKLPGMLAP